MGASIAFCSLQQSPWHFWCQSQMFSSNNREMYVFMRYLYLFLQDFRFATIIQNLCLCIGKPKANISSNIAPNCAKVLRVCGSPRLGSHNKMCVNDQGLEDCLLLCREWCRYWKNDVMGLCGGQGYSELFCCHSLCQLLISLFSINVLTSSMTIYYLLCISISFWKCHGSVFHAELLVANVQSDHLLLSPINFADQCGCDSDTPAMHQLPMVNCLMGSSRKQPRIITIVGALLGRFDQTRTKIPDGDISSEIVYHPRKYLDSRARENLKMRDIRGRIRKTSITNCWSGNQGS